MRLYCFIFFFGLATWTVAQEQLPTGQIEVIKDFEVKLMESKKIRIVPQPIQLDSNVRHYVYSLNAPSPVIEYHTPEIKPLAINPEQKPTYYPLFAKAGYGSPNSVLAAVSYDHLQNDALQWGIDINHLSANNKKKSLQKFSDSWGRVDGRYLLNDDVQIEAYVDARFQKGYFYGADFIPTDENLLRRKFNRYDAAFSIERLATVESSFTYRGSLQYGFDKDDLGSRESGARIAAEVGSAIGKNRYPVGIGVEADLSKLKHTETLPVNNLLIIPFFEYHIGDLKIHLGGIGLLNSDQNEVLPDIGLSYALFGERLMAMAGWVGQVQKNNFHTLSMQNPYIESRLDSLNNEVSRKIYAGVSGSAGSLRYEITGAYSSFTGKAFFLQDFLEEYEFKPIYDDGYFIGGEGALQYEVLKNVDLRVQAYGRVYKLDHENKPWHVPSLGVSGMVSYAGGSDEYHVSLTFHGENGLPYRTLGGTESRLDALLDLNLHGDYYITPSLGAFVQVNNILGNNRERWYRYPNFGFNAKAGILFRLPQ